MSEIKKGNNFIQNVDKFFRRVQNQDLITLGGKGKINFANSPQSKEELKLKQQMQVFRQYLQNKNWNLKHIEFFDEYRRMDSTFPIINAALRLYSQEVCYSLNDTKIQLLNGETKTLKELLEGDYKNFWAWGYDNDQKKIIPVKCEKVISKGFKEVLEIKLDDGTILKCTPEHKHLLKSGEWVEAKDLKEGDSLRSIYTKISDKGYLQLSDGEVCKMNKKKLKWKHAHSIVANEVDFLVEQKNNLNRSKFDNKRDNTPVCHHKSFVKLNNDPNELEWMLWYDHLKLHETGYNQRLRWENISEEEKQRRIELIRQARKDFWSNPEKAEKKSKHHSKKMKEFFSSMTKEERKLRHNKLQPFNENHNWWGRNTSGRNNPHANHDKLFFEDFSIEFLDSIIPFYCDKSLFSKDYNASGSVINEYKKLKKCKCYWDFSYPLLVELVKKAATEQLIFSNNELVDYIKEIGYKGFSLKILGRYIKKLGYTNLKTFIKYYNTQRVVEKVNHKVASITYNKEVVEVGDVVNAGDVHNFAVKCNEGMIIVHNCITGDSIITTPSGEKTIKELYDEKKSLFFVDSFHPHFNIAINSECRGVVSNGIKDVYEVTVVRNIDEITAQSDTKTVAKFKCTDNHKIMLPDKSFKELKDLKIGDTIFAKYISVDPSCSCKKQNFVTTIITDIKHVGQEEVFDLLNVTPHHNFSLKLTDSFYIYVHNCNKDADGDIFKIISDDKSIKKSLNECFYDNLKLDSKSYLYVRSMLKFGNLFGFLETRRGVGVTDIINLPPESIRIMLLQQADRLDQFNYIWNGYGGGIEFDPWEIVHWKIIEDIEHEPYGQSILRSIVDTWRRIVLMREALIIYRITRAPQRFLFKIDTTGLDGDAALRFAEQMKKQLTKKPLVNPITGEIDAKFTTASVLEDFYMPTQEGDVGDVRILEGATNLDQVEDYKIIKDDLFAGLLIPKSYLSFEEDLCMTGDTNIPTLSGVDKSMEVLAEDYKNGIKNYVYASDEQGNIVPGEVVWAGQTKEVDEIYEVTLDNDEVVKCTGNHPFRLRNGEYKNAEDLIEGESLMPFYTKVNESGYENIFHNDKAKWEATHQMVAKYRNSNCYKQEGQGKKVVHHKDFNKRNNNPENLQECTQKEHIQYHKEIAYKNLCSETSRQKAKAKRETKEYKENLSNIRKKYFLENEKASEVISLTNKKLKKTSLMLKKHKELVAVKEVSQFGKNNGNYKGMITYEELLIIKNLGVNGFGDFKEKIKNLFPSKAVNFNIQTYANAFNFSKKEFCEFLGFKYVNSSKRVFMIDEKTFIERIKKGEVYNSIIKDMGYSSTVVDNYFQHKYGKSFFNYQEENLENIYFNHKVKSVKRVKLDTPIKVYDITVDKYHNFALSAGVFVHNCLRSSELVLTNEGKVTIEDLANIFSETPDKKIYTLSCSEFGLITHGKINWCRATKKVETLYRIHLSNGRYNDVTDNHPFLLESMIYKRADELKVGDVIKNIYEKEISVVNIEFLELEDSEYVYDLEVEKYHNFALDSGIFVHNSNKAALCLHPDTKVELLDGRSKTMLEISEEIKTNDNLWVYSYNKEKNEIEPTKIKWCKKTKENAELVRVTLDNGEYIDSTPDHRFILKGGEEIQAQFLKEGDSLQAGYKRRSNLRKNTDYDQVYQPNINKWVWVHKLVDNFFNKEILNESYNGFDNVRVVHHKDFNRFNNNPDNLERLSNKEHRLIHMNAIKQLMHTDEVKRKLKEYWSSKEFSDSCKKVNAELNNDPIRFKKKSNKCKLNRLQQLENNPALKFILRDAWLSMSFEERSNIVKNGWHKNPERSRIQGKNNKSRNSSQHLKKGYQQLLDKYNGKRPDISGKNHCKYVEEISTEMFVEVLDALKGQSFNNFKEIMKFIRANFNFKPYAFYKKITTEFVDKTTFCNHFIGTGKGRALVTKDVKEVLNGYETLEQFKGDYQFMTDSYDQHYEKHLNKTYNHKVVSVEFLSEKVDTYDLEVESDNHNFLTTAGVFVHNSQEDLRFNNAVKQYQSYYIDGMMHVALVHLYMNGYSKDELESFELQMNGSSTLAEKAKNELLQQRIDLANSALTQTIDGISLMSFTNVLKDILKFTDEEIAETFKNQMIENKLIWQLKQLRDEGYAEDPDPNKKKARMKGMIDQLDVFKDLQFEASEQLPKVGEIISRKLDKEIKSLVGGNKKKPSKKMIESVVNLHESKVKKNIKKTYTDLGMKPEDGE